MAAETNHNDNPESRLWQSILNDFGPVSPQDNVTLSIDDAIDARLAAANINPWSLSESAGFSDEEAGLFGVAPLNPWAAYGDEAYDFDNQRPWPWGSLYE